MAKRKRLTPPAAEALSTQGAASGGRASGGLPGGLSPALGADPARRAPIADVAGAAAATAALSEVAAELEAARSEGRLVQALPLEVIAADHLMRDRLTHAVSAEEMIALVESLRLRGQQTPIEVTALGGGRYGLISGWRRLSALRRLHETTGEARFGTVLALVRSPETAQDAYVAMVEENEIRAGLSFFERAQIVERAVQNRVYKSDKQALISLFGSVSRAKRSKIKSFMVVVRELGAALSHPTQISERLGLKLAARLEDPVFAKRLRAALEAAGPENAAAEAAVLMRALAPASASATGSATGLASDPSPAPSATTEPGPGEAAEAAEVAPGVTLSREAGALRLSGPGVTEAFEARLREALKRL